MKFKFTQAYNLNNYKLRSEKSTKHIIYEAYNIDIRCLCKSSIIPISFDVNKVLLMQMVIDNNDSFLSDALSIMCT